ncbi:hypothetical protein RND64_20125 [Gordonia sp. w5E2]|uniref:Membrane transport protein MMPL domain-containing protein n=1 Tax=Gordonia aichiensis NBRC 108223 TaxID=1220583 RepID=L7KSG7_9ACTN|nr:MULTISPECIES: hypothetical protein [Gordonia]MCM3896369.1 hypothetical protein [Gordonia sputi]UEA57409.1 hypothetical protein LK459_12250 [Gordonia otitidis]GAC50902.1 hypothetical protein GOACH_33_00230 [Gordonia aichiensis NBRC 108223]SKY38892.1 Uncharacterised protein [Mycobacteroides abscessus subsp. abscessus]
MNQQKSAVVENSPQQPSPPGSPGVLYRWGVLMARRRRAVLAVWGLLLVVCAVAYPLLENRLGAMDFGVEGSESTEVDRLVARHFPQFGTEQAVIVLQSGAVTATDAEFRAAVARTITAATAVEGVVDVVGPYDGLPGSDPRSRPTVTSRSRSPAWTATWPNARKSRATCKTPSPPPATIPST